MKTKIKHEYADQKELAKISKADGLILVDYRFKELPDICKDFVLLQITYMNEYGGKLQESDTQAFKDLQLLYPELGAKTIIKQIVSVLNGRGDENSIKRISNLLAK